MNTPTVVRGATRTFCLLIGAALATGLSGAALAAGSGAAADPSSSMLQAVIVTAQKVHENVQRVPIAMSVITSRAIAETHVDNLQALSGAVPDVQIGHFSNVPTSAVFTIRGMGVIEPDPYAGSAVSVVMDGVPLLFNLIQLPDLFDVQRVEVLKGPQGTLFGANTIGGVINIVTRQPTGHYDARAQVTVGNYSRTDADLAVDFPIIKHVLAGKITAIHHTEDGYVTNVVNGTPMGSQNMTGVRGYLKWTPNRDFNATLIQEVDIARDGSPIVVQGAVPGEAEYVAPGTKVAGDLMGQYPSPCVPAGHPCHAPNHYYSAISSVPNMDNMDIYATTLTMNARTPIGQLVSISGFRRFWEDQYTDQDGTVLFLDDTQRITSGYQVTEEVRDMMRPTRDLRLLVGTFLAYYQYHHMQNFRIQFALPGLRNLTTQNEVNNSESIFAQVFYHITPKLEMEAGARVTSSGKRMLAGAANFLNPSGVGSFYGGMPLPGAFSVNRKRRWDNVGGKIDVNYQWTNSIMSYAYVARGFKSGGFVGRLGLPTDIGPFGPEFVTTVETGLKADWLNHTLRTNVALFYNWFRNMQIDEIYFRNINGTTVQGNSILNAAKSKTEGAELDLTAAPTSRLMLNASIAYLYARYTNFNFPLPTGTYIDMSGRPLQNSPPITATAGFNYEIPLPVGHFSIAADDRYTGALYDTSPADTPRSRIQPTNYVDANINWYPRDDDNLSFSLWGRNLADRHYIASVYDAPGTLGLVNYAAPREFGFTVSVKMR